jgi:hypothetical protein
MRDMICAVKTSGSVSQVPIEGSPRLSLCRTWFGFHFDFAVNN